jgi:2-polyprenyl-3-methyl-5-hydroxy-6-metoxy-1,4-benzoquinol methylase
LIEPFIGSYVNSKNVLGKILDYGCGSAELGDYLTTTHKVIVDSYDSSSELISRAKKSSGLVTDNASNLTNDYDLVILSLVLSAVEDPKNILSKMKNYLSVNGQVLIIIPHPSFSILTKYHSTIRREWISSEKIADELRYFDNPVQKIYWSNDEQMFTYIFYRTLEDYIHIFIKMGYRIVNIFEPKPVASGNTNHQLYKKYNRMPSFLSFVLENEP